MSIDERIEKLVGVQESMQTEMARMLVAMTTALDIAMRLERIAISHSVSLDDLDTRLTELENRRRSKPQ